MGNQGKNEDEDRKIRGNDFDFLILYIKIRQFSWKSKKKFLGYSPTTIECPKG